MEMEESGYGKQLVEAMTEAVRAAIRAGRLNRDVVLQDLLSGIASCSDPHCRSCRLGESLIEKIESED